MAWRFSWFTRGVNAQAFGRFLQRCRKQEIQDMVIAVVYLYVIIIPELFFDRLLCYLTEPVMLSCIKHPALARDGKGLLQERCGQPYFLPERLKQALCPYSYKQPATVSITDVSGRALTNSDFSPEGSLQTISLAEARLAPGGLPGGSVRRTKRGVPVYYKIRPDTCK